MPPLNTQPKDIPTINLQKFTLAGRNVDPTLPIISPELITLSFSLITVMSAFYIPNAVFTEAWKC